MSSPITDAPEHGWLIHKAGRGWYRPNAHGYTSSTAEAGRFSRKDALKYSHPNGWSGPRDNITIKHESEVSDRAQLPRVQLYTEDQLAAAEAAAFRRGQEHMMKRAAHICAMVEPETKTSNALESAILNIGFTEGRKLCERAIRALPVEESQP